MSTDNGGPAFPGFGQVWTTDANGNTNPQSAWGMDGAPGMSLRDWFAGQALMGLMPSWWTRGYSTDDMTTDAYSIADAMLVAREAKP